jgi:tetratricopeptide (TPR) repeat protein
MLAALISAFAVRATLVRDRNNSQTVPDAPPEDRVTSPDANAPAGPRTEHNPGTPDEGGSGASLVARRPERSRAVVTSLTVAGLIVLLGFAPASRLTARELPTVPARLPAVVTGVQHGTATAVRDVPVGLPPNARIRTAADVLPYAVAALGPSSARALMAVLRSSSDLGGGPVGVYTNHLQYPYQYPAFDAVVRKASSGSFGSGALALGAALTVLAAQPPVTGPGQSGLALQNASAAAYSVLNRDRAAGGCAAQVDLLLLVASDEITSTGVLSREEQLTEQACPHDPTPGWLVGQAQLRSLDLWVIESLVSTAPPGGRTLVALHTALATFTGLAAGYPRDTGALTGLGDAYLRAGTLLMPSEPFTARKDFQSAVTAYDRAVAAGGARNAAPGLARALIGLGEPAEAIRVLTPFATASAYPGPWLEILIAADEAAHDFGAAETAAQRLGRLGPSAYPAGTFLFPRPTTSAVDTLSDMSLPLSLGADALTPLTAVLILPGGAGGSVQDLSFIPEYRDDPGITGTQASCASGTWRRDAILDGQAAHALAGWPAQFTSSRPGTRECGWASKLKPVAEAAAGVTQDTSTYSSDATMDSWQNLLRWAGHLPAAAKVAKQWQSTTGDKESLPALRLGEIDFLMHQYNDAAAEFGLAGRRARLIHYNDDLGVDQAELDRGAALLAAGRSAEGTQVLRPLDSTGTLGNAYQNSLPNGNGVYAPQFAAVSYYACEELADYERESGNLHAAVEDYTTALDWTPQLAEGSGARPEVLDNNAALAYLGLGDTSTAASLESKALAVDPANPVFLMTAGFIADRAGRVAEAAHYDREALASDPGIFPAANDLGIELTREHQDGAAVTALRQSVGASPGYALGWFNLGVLEAKLAPSGQLASQGAFAVADALNPTLKNRRPDMTIDASVYRTALDLSKPLPPQWSFSQLQRPAPAVAAGLLAIAGLGFGLARAAAKGSNNSASQVLQIVERFESAPGLKRFHHPGWGLAATAATFMLAALHRESGLTEIVASGIGALILAAAAMSARAALARRRGLTIAHSSWPPGLVLGLVTGAFGLPWAPLPVVRTDTDEDDPGLHLLAPCLLAGVSLLLFVESAWLHTPITQTWAVAALIMSASTLLPIGPLDGAHVGKAGIAAGAGVVGGALLVSLGLI